MCGIVGIYAFEGPAPYRELWEDLTNLLYHRGPDDGAIWSEGPFFFGHRRLSIIGINSGRQPLLTPEKDLAVTYNGEIYNYPALRDELESLGHSFRTETDTEVLLHGYREWGVELPKKLIGMFAFGIADRKQGELFLARDRFGEKPLLYRVGPDYLAFASELKVLTALPDHEPRIDPDSLLKYLSLNYVPGTAMLLSEVQRVEPGSWLLWRGTKREARHYWRPPSLESRAAIKLADAKEELRVRLDLAVKDALLSDVPVGVLLSGGMDSSLIAESAVRQGNLSNAYCLDFQESTYSEFSGAQRVANKLGLPIERVEIGPKAASDFLNIVSHADDPLADSSALAVWTLTRKAGAGNKVVLSGDGGDELFGGYLTYLASLWHQRFIARLPMAARRILKTVSTTVPIGESKVTTSYKLWRFLRAADLPVETAHLTWNGTWLPNEAQDFLTMDTESKGIEELLRIDLKNGGAVLDALQRFDLQEYLSNDILTKTDRISMAHSLETRAPFLVPVVSEWALTLPPALRCTMRGKLKVLLRALARDVLGPEVADRPKRGFSIPVHSWIRGPLREEFDDLLAPASVEEIGVLDPALVAAKYAEHLSGRRSYGFELWGLAVLMAWYRMRIKRRSTSKNAEKLAVVGA